VWRINKRVKSSVEGWNVLRIRILDFCVGGRPYDRGTEYDTYSAAASSSSLISSFLSWLAFAVTCKESSNISRRSFFGFRPRLDFFLTCLGGFSAYSSGLSLDFASCARRLARCEFPRRIHALYLLCDALETLS
jgi:hypothetical protein